MHTTVTTHSPEPGLTSTVCVREAAGSTYRENDVAATTSLERAVSNLLFELAMPFLCYILPCFLQPTVYTVSVKQTEKLAPGRITAAQAVQTAFCCTLSETTELYYVLS